LPPMMPPAAHGRPAGLASARVELPASGTGALARSCPSSFMVADATLSGPFPPTRPCPREPSRPRPHWVPASRARGTVHRNTRSASPGHVPTAVRSAFADKTSWDKSALVCHRSGFLCSWPFLSLRRHPPGRGYRTAPTNIPVQRATRFQGAAVLPFHVLLNARSQLKDSKLSRAVRHDFRFAS
jgi:hypothetical protein